MTEYEYVSLAHVPYRIPVDIFQGARVAWFMGEGESGRWRLSRFEVTEEQYQRKVFNLHHFSDRPDAEIAREVPPGEYISLQRRMTEREMRGAFKEQIGLLPDQVPDEIFQRIMPPEVQWTPIMSDTPAEIIEHGPALLGARGRVLITGLGLGVLPHALLALDTLDGYGSVERIDIIEIDADVIALTGVHLADERVHIWQGSAADLSVIPEDVRAEGWDFAWHDIWSHVASRNLRDDEAEHGISYGKLFSLWGPHVHGEQSAWAYEQAQEMDRVLAAERAEELEFRLRLKAAPFEEQVQLTMTRILQDRFNFGANLNALADVDMLGWDVIRKIDQGGKLEAHIRKELSDPTFWDRFAADVEAVEGDPDPLGNPNEELESNRG